VIRKCPSGVIEIACGGKGAQSAIPQHEVWL